MRWMRTGAGCNTRNSGCESGGKGQTVSKPDGGPAFPSAEAYLDNSGFKPVSMPGMTLRDYFASHAPVRAEVYVPAGIPRVGLSEIQLDILWCWEYADAMIKERDK